MKTKKNTAATLESAETVKSTKNTKKATKAALKGLVVKSGLRGGMFLCHCY